MLASSSVYKKRVCWSLSLAQGACRKRKEQSNLQDEVWVLYVASLFKICTAKGKKEKKLKGKEEKEKEKTEQSIL